MEGLTIGNWIALAAVAVGIISASFTSANYLASRRERQRNAQKNQPKIKATINARQYEGGWRSVQLHVVPMDESRHGFPYASWRIESARLLRPKSAILARAVNDDYASGAFHPEQPVRVIKGKPEGRPQRFALEFFIKFQGEVRGQEASFKVIFTHSTTGKRFNTVISARVPANLELHDQCDDSP